MISSTLGENWENQFENKVILRVYMNLFQYDHRFVHVSPTLCEISNGL